MAEDQNNQDQATAEAVDLNAMVRRFIRMFGCDTARITSPCGTHYLVLGWNKNTKTERENGGDTSRWYKDGEPIDFDYIHEQIVASGNTFTELIKSAKHYKKLMKMKWSDYFREELGADKKIVDALKAQGL